MKPRVVIAGLGDTGLLVALDLYPDFDVVGISTKPSHVSGQELGTRVARPDDWRRNYLTPYDRYRKLAGMTVVQAQLVGLSPERRTVRMRGLDGTESELPYDVLVIATGVSNGFWRDPRLEDQASLDRRIADDAKRFAEARTVAVLGGGATGVSAASNLKETYPDKAVHLFHSGAEPLPGYHPKARRKVLETLQRQGVERHPDHRAKLPPDFRGERLTTGPVEFTSGQPPFDADVVLWALGQQRPNTDWVPADLLDPSGYVRTDPYLRVPGHDAIFAVGDVAATDPNRSSARNSGFLTLAHNVRCSLAGKPSRMKRYRASPYRWGSILGTQRDGMRVFTPGGMSVRIGPWWVRHVLYPFIVDKLIYKGISRTDERATDDRARLPP